MIIKKIPIGDLKLTNGDLVIIDGVDQIKQAIWSNFRFFLGEWFLDTREGVPYFQEILVKSPDMGTVSSAFRSALLKTVGVIEILTFRLEHDRPTRTLRFDFSVRVQGNEVLIVRPTDESFVVRLDSAA